YPIARSHAAPIAGGANEPRGVSERTAPAGHVPRGVIYRSSGTLPGPWSGPAVAADRDDHGHCITTGVLLGASAPLGAMSLYWSRPQQIARPSLPRTTQAFWSPESMPV